MPDIKARIRGDWIWLVAAFYGMHQPLPESMPSDQIVFLGPGKLDTGRVTYALMRVGQNQRTEHENIFSSDSRTIGELTFADEKKRGTLITVTFENPDDES